MLILIHGKILATENHVGFVPKDDALKCVVTEVFLLGFYNLMDVDADPRISAGHHSVSERCLSLTVNPHID